MKRRLSVVLVLTLIVSYAALISMPLREKAAAQETVDYVTAFDFSALADKYATAHSLDWTVRVWEASSNQLLHTIQVPDYRNRAGSSYKLASIRSVVFSPSGERLAIAPWGDMPGLILIVETASGETLLEISTPPILAIDWSPDGKYLVGEYDYTPLTHSEALGCFEDNIALWDTETGDELKQSRCGGGSVSLDWQPSGDKIIYTDSSQGVVFWDVNSWQKLYTLRANGVVSAAWSPSGDKLAAASVYSLVHIWDGNSGELLRGIRMRVLEHEIPKVFWSPDGKVIGIVVSNRIQLWDANTGESVFCAEIPEMIIGTALSPDGRIVVAPSIGDVVTLETTLSQTPNQ
jgi:WD40 repeat protein